MPRFRVAIIGAGMAGLLQALAIEQISPDVEVHVYESASQLAEVGAGIGMHLRVWAIAKALGIDQALLELGGETTEDSIPPTSTYRKADQPEGVDFFRLGTKLTQRLRLFHRSQLQAILMGRLTTSQLHLSKRLVTYSQPKDTTAPIEMRFADGTIASCDALIGADGIKSVVREVLYHNLADKAEARGDSEGAVKLRDLSTPVWSGSVMYRALIPMEKVQAQSAPHEPPVKHRSVLYSGKGRLAVCYPIVQGTVLNFAASSFQPDKAGTIYDGPWVSASDHAELKRNFGHSEREFEAILDSTEGLKPLRWVINMVQKIPTYVDGRVALIGDAAHAMVPFQASGAGQAFEDGFTLAHVLADPRVTLETLPAALKAYDDIRRPFAQAVSDGSFQTGLYAHLCDGPGFKELTPEQSRTGTAVTLEQLQALGDKIEHSMDWMAETTAADNCAKAIQRLGELLA